MNFENTYLSESEQTNDHDTGVVPFAVVASYELSAVTVNDHLTASDCKLSIELEFRKQNIVNFDAIVES